MTTMTGYDISGWQAGIDIASVPGDFVLIKMTGGNGYVNPYGDAMYQAAKAAGKLVGIYAYAHEAGCASDAVTEANFFIANCKGYFDGNTLLVLDFESDNSWDVAWAKLWLDTVFAATGVRPVIYLNMSELNSSDWSPVYGADYGLWIARYAVTSPTDGYNNYAGTPAVDDAPPAVNWGGASPLMWQYADNARLPGYNGGLDADVCYGDAGTWHAYCNPSGTVASTPTVVAAPVQAPVAPVKPVASQVYNQCIVASGDTMSGIAVQFGVDLGAFEGVNPTVNPDRIYPGQVLNLPTGHSAPVPARAYSQCIVSDGDTMSAIAAQFNEPLSTLEAHNPTVNPDLIFPGEVLNL